ncbi:MAG: chemotaxis protein CheA [Deltaproteobacteria bacterium HGW-Deltaproteobacteria-19]|jgi:two-component system chemotaxis sensor kinase CheA|nr:MAG: chemotaxis protein CheA [Deltaproteobacteria bacterium HGW-Deltaproteobacteria-19]
MEKNKLANKIDEMASDFLFLEGQEIDIPTAGKFLNYLEGILQEAASEEFAPLQRVAGGMNLLLERMVIDALDDKKAGFAALESGLQLLQGMTRDNGHPEQTGPDPKEFLQSVTALTGVVMTETAAEPDSPASEAAPASAENAPPEEDPDAVAFQDEGLLRDFIIEALEYIGEIEVNILNLEQNPEDREYINVIFRPFHSIKGVAGFLNLNTIRTLAHNLENLLDKARNGELSVTPPVIDVVLDGADAVKSMVVRLKDRLEGRTAPAEPLDTTSIYERIKAIEEGRGELTQKPARLGEILKSDGAITEKGLDAGLKATQVEPGKKLGEALIEEGIATPKQVTQALRKQSEQTTDTATIRVDIRKLDDMIDMVGELVITHSMIQQNISRTLHADRSLTQNVAQFSRITSGLQRASTSLRMVPIKQTFQRMSRLIRDLAKGNGKNVGVEMEGEDTEIDRNMVDEIYNPLVHLVRNAVDHGLETPEERLQTDKPEKGLVRLKAYHRGGNIIIEIADDGRGLNREKIIRKAEKSGLITGGEVMTDQEVFRLILLPGLSTAEKVTDVSGRGVGMDVVKQAVEKLRGKIEIESRQGEGTRFVTSFPLTLAIIDGMIVQVGPERYILPTMAIRQALRPSPGTYTNAVGKGEMIHAMGRLFPLVRLNELFAIEDSVKDPMEAIMVLTEGEGRSKCLMVDEILGKTEVVIKSLGDGMKNHKGVSGGAILGDGQIGLILDVEGVFELSETNS